MIRDQLFLFPELDFFKTKIKDELVQKELKPMDVF